MHNSKESIWKAGRLEQPISGCDENI